MDKERSDTIAIELDACQITEKPYGPRRQTYFEVMIPEGIIINGIDLSGWVYKSKFKPRPVEGVPGRVVMEERYDNRIKHVEDPETGQSTSLRMEDLERALKDLEAEETDEDMAFNLIEDDEVSDTEDMETLVYPKRSVSRLTSRHYLVTIPKGVVLQGKDISFWRYITTAVPQPIPGSTFVSLDMPSWWELVITLEKDQIQATVEELAYAQAMAQERAKAAPKQQPRRRGGLAKGGAR
jgi:hypothetical protein